MKISLFAHFAFAALLATGCSSSDGDPAAATDSGGTPADTLGSDTSTPGTDAAGSDTLATDTPATDTPPGACDERGTAPACNNVKPSGDFIVTQQVAEAYTTAPVAGTLAEGTYVLTKSTDYTGAGGATGPSSAKPAKSTGFYGCGHYDQYYEVQGAPGFTLNADGTIEGTKMKLHGTCPGVADSGFTISITATGFLGYNLDPAGKGNVAEYAKK
ncbi:MAG: hypothetical protein ABI175_29695 [Polyangiales bacterium]